MRYGLIVLWMMLGSLTPAVAQLSINFSTPGVSIGINLPVYPQLQRVPGYPVYYAPAVSSNYFFFDGLYWVFEGDNWYASSWYNGPWRIVDSMDVPLYLLRVPVRYYRRAPVYFRGWRQSDPPRWGDHWGQSWTQRRSGWDQWNRNAMPAPAPLPTYQRQYSGSRYPQASQQAVLQTRNYRYQPGEAVAQQHFQQQRAQAQSVQPTSAAPQPPAQQSRPAPAPRQQPSQQLKPQQTGQPQNAPATREPPASKPPAQRAERQPQPAPAARETPASKPPAQRAERQPQPAPAARETPASKPPAQRAERQPQPAPAARETPASKPPAQRAERQPQPAPAAREQQAPRQQAREKAPPAKDNKDKDEKEPKEKGRDR